MRRSQPAHPPAQDNSPPGIPLTQAATLLGIERETLRARIRRGKLAACKVDGQWYVQVPGPRTMPRTVSSANTTLPSVDMSMDVPVGITMGTTADMSTGTAQDGELVAELQHELAFLRDEVGFLRGELEQKNALLTSLTEQLALANAAVRAVVQPVVSVPVPPPPDLRPGPAVIRQAARQESRPEKPQPRRDGDPPTRKHHLSSSQAVRLSLYRLLARLLAR